MKARNFNAGYWKRNVVLFFLMILLIAVVAFQKVNAQDISKEKPIPIISLVVENTTTHQHVYFVVGQKTKYKIHSSTGFLKGYVSAITDSTISFRNGKADITTFPHKAIEALKIPRHGSRKVAGTILIGAGLAGLFEAVTLASEPASTSPGMHFSFRSEAGPVALVGAALIGGGIAMMVDRKIVLNDSWKVTTTRELIVGNVVSVVMKNGEAIKSMKVTFIDTEKIIGIQTLTGSDGLVIHPKKTILVKDVLEYSRPL